MLVLGFSAIETLIFRVKGLLEGLATLMGRRLLILE